jgi:hypothetical protein
MPDLLKPADAAKRLGICEKLLRRHVDAGDLLAVDVGRGATKRRLRYDPVDLDAFEEKRKTSGKPCQSGNDPTDFINSISKSNVVDLMARLASATSAPPRNSSAPKNSARARKSKS